MFMFHPYIKYTLYQHTRTMSRPSSSLRYLITAPLSVCVDAVETVLLQLFGFPEEVTVHVFLKTSMAPDHVVLAREVVALNTQNHHQAAAKVRVGHNTHRDLQVSFKIYPYVKGHLSLTFLLLSSCSQVSWIRA